MAITNNDRAPETSDGLSLHTIAEQADAYATQEQEDADFALALSLEDAESRNLLAAQSPRPNERGDAHGAEDRRAEQSHTLPPYRDEPAMEGDSENSVDSLPPYRDDPDVATSIDTESATAPSRPRRNYFRILRKVGKVWLCYMAIGLIISILVVAIVLLVVLGPAKNGRETAWRESHSTDYDLQLLRLYPQLEEGASEQCREQWGRWQLSLKCHRSILDTALDDGNPQDVSAAHVNPLAVSQEVCKDSCLKSISSLQYKFNNCYGRTDRFDLIKYGNGSPTYLNKEKVEQGPAHVYENLMQRYDRLCTKPPENKGQAEGGTCATELWTRWGVIDGKHEANLNGLDSFLDSTKEKKTIEGRIVGPGPGETECGYCTLDWLERKMRSFEYGEILDPSTHRPLSLEQFNNRLQDAVNRCELSASAEVLRRVRDKWVKLGWWCGRTPCRKQPYVAPEVEGILHGMLGHDWVLPSISRQIQEGGARKDALVALHDGVLRLPCSISYSEWILPYSNLVNHICSDRCRNAIDRLQKQHGEVFATAANDLPADNVFQAWDHAQERVNKTCLNDAPLNVVKAQTSFCAPGYAAVGHPEWIFAQSAPSKTDILSAFSKEIDALEKKLPLHAPKRKEDHESMGVLVRTMTESVCNTCASGLLIGWNPNHNKRINEFYDDDDIDRAKYTHAAKQWLRTCTRMSGVKIPDREWNRIWERLGLDPW